MMKNKGTNVNGTSTSYIRGLLNQTESVPLAGSRSANPGSIPLRQSFEVADADSSMGVIETIFGARLRNEIPPDLFYARARRAMIPQEGGQPAEIILRTSFDPINSQVVVRPMALGGRQISGEMTWHGTDTPIGAAELRLRFSDGFSRAEMTSVNDPLNVLTRGLELKGGAPSYLSTLRPTTIVEPLPVRVTEPSLAVAGETASRAAGTLPEAITTPATSALPADPLVPTSARSTTGGRAGSGSLLRPLISGSAPAGLRQLTNLSY